MPRSVPSPDFSGENTDFGKMYITTGCTLHILEAMGFP